MKQRQLQKTQKNIARTTQYYSLASTCILACGSQHYIVHRQSGQYMHLRLWFTALQCTQIVWPVHASYIVVHSIILYICSLASTCILDCGSQHYIVHRQSGQYMHLRLWFTALYCTQIVWPVHASQIVDQSIILYIGSLASTCILGCGSQHYIAHMS